MITHGWELISVDNTTTLSSTDCVGSTSAIDFNAFEDLTTDGDGSNTFSWHGGNTGSFTTWKSNCSCDAHSVFGTFASLSIGAGGIPSAGSPIVAAGDNLSTLAIIRLDSDNKGLVRSASTAWDMGAFNASATAYGMTLGAHPRLFWTPARIATAQTWVTSTGYTGRTSATRFPLDDYDVLFTCVVMGDSTACGNAITDALAVDGSSCYNAAGCPPIRTSETVYLTRDWLAPGCSFAQCLTSAQASTLDTNWNLWLSTTSGQDSVYWGNTKRAPTPG